MSTSDTARNRSIPVSILAVVALVAALLTSTLASEHSASAVGHRADATTGSTHATTMAGVTAHRALTARESAFHDQMRKLWEDHVTWTRLAIVTFADGSHGFGATSRRLLQNQTDIGNAIKPFYGAAAGSRLTALLDQHILIAVEILQAAKAGESAKATAAVTRWYANANDIADFLAGANPRFWPRSMMRADMRTHLDQTLAEAQHELVGDYADSVADYEAIHEHILAMADVLSGGIIRTFPGRFR
jgi:hypothetical protein